jgi:hypothetical protein
VVDYYDFLYKKNKNLDKINYNLDINFVAILLSEGGKGEQQRNETL